MSLRIFGAAVFVIAAFYTWYGKGYTVVFGDVLGPSVFPVILGIPAMLLAASLVLVPGGTVSWPDRSHLARQAAALVVLLGYAWLLKPLGFVPATFALIAALAVVLGGALRPALGLGAVLALGLWALFDKVLGLPLAFLGTVFGG